jgi:hypothetical protein
VGKLAFFINSSKIHSHYEESGKGQIRPRSHGSYPDFEFKDIEKFANIPKSRLIPS